MSRLLTVKEVAKLMRVTPKYVYELIYSGYLTALKLPTLKITEQALTEFLDHYQGQDLSDLSAVTALHVEERA
ncbi:MAG: helix-turn-helix domain-containing protein [Ruminiclostridium sp.]